MGLVVGDSVGLSVGTFVEELEGCSVGFSVGNFVGGSVGLLVGDLVGDGNKTTGLLVVVGVGPNETSFPSSVVRTGLLELRNAPSE